MTHWMCEKCDFVIERDTPPDPCPSCMGKCAFTDVTCYRPECGIIGSLDTRLVAERAFKTAKPGKLVRFSDITKGGTAEGKEKHLPVIELTRGSSDKDSVEVAVGKTTPHPNTPEHYIVWIHLFGIKKTGQVVDLGRAEFKAGIDKPLYATSLNSTEYSNLLALAYCNIHGLWEYQLTI